MAMNTPATFHSLRIETMPDGGFLVTRDYRYSGEMMPMLFACTTIEEALRYIKRKLTTERTSS
jgi:hypothetical protein